MVYSKIRLVLLSGDWIPLGLPDKIKNKYKQSEVVSLGGATEAAIWSIYYPVHEINSEWSSIPYGIPLANQKMYVLNYNQQLCPFDVEGEIYIGGAGLANEYRGEEEKTKKNFINHPELGRLYRTGDYGIVRKDEKNVFIQFRGRMDKQVKIRGYRVELEEIEKCMLQVEGIEEALVVDYEDQRGNKYLCGYYVSKHEQEVSYIKKKLLEMMPDYMVPLQFVRISKIPLSGNGKVNRKKLVKANLVQKSKNYVGARNELEKKLVRIFEEELKCENIGIEDDFFSLGINSILMGFIINRIEKELHINIRFKEIVDMNCIVELAVLIGNKAEKQEYSEIYSKAKADWEQENNSFPMTEIQNSYLIGRKGVFELGNISTHGYMEFATTLDITKMNWALNKVIDRQGMLRCVFNEDGTQHILEKGIQYEIEVEDLSQISKEAQIHRINKIRERMSHYVFDPQKWPLFEVSAVKLDEKTNYVFAGYDLLIADGASIQIVNSELLEYYRNPELELPELEFTFRDYMIAYEKFKIESEVYKKDKEYWLSQLDDFPMAPALPLKKEISKVKKVRFNRKQKIFTKDDYLRIKQKAKEIGVTTTALVCAAYCEVLFFWSNQPRFALNMTVFNRYPFHKDVEKIVGEFTSTILLEVDLTSRNDFLSRVKALQSRLLESIEHRHYEGIEFIREISRYHNFGLSTVMPIVFSSMLFDDKYEIDLREEEIRTRQSGISQTSQVYLDCQVSDVGGELTVIIDYVEELFKESVINGIFTQFTEILMNLIDPGEDYELDISKEEQQIIEVYNNTDCKVDDMTLHDLFRKQAKKSPDNLACMLDDASMTYEELDKRSNQVARYFKEQGVKRGDYVAIEGSRQLSTIVNILGILKVGAAYVPVDPAYPKERRKYILENSHAKMYVESSLYQDKYIETYEEGEIEGNFFPQDVAYIIYTSGSTGNPKGVVITHKAACNTIMDMNERFKVTSKDRLIGISSMCFDLSVYDVFGTFAAGAALVMVPDQRNVRHLLEEMEKKEVTVWSSVPSIMNLAVEIVRNENKKLEILWENEEQNIVEEGLNGQ